MKMTAYVAVWRTLSTLSACRDAAMQLAQVSIGSLIDRPTTPRLWTTCTHKLLLLASTTTVAYIRPLYHQTACLTRSDPARLWSKLACMEGYEPMKWKRGRERNWIIE